MQNFRVSQCAGSHQVHARWACFVWVFVMLHVSLVKQSQEVESIRQEVNDVKAWWIQWIFKIIFNAFFEEKKK